MMRARWLTLAATLLAGCGTPPTAGDTVWVSVSRVFKPADLEQAWNHQHATRVHAAGLTCGDVKAIDFSNPSAVLAIYSSPLASRMLGQHAVCATLYTRQSNIGAVEACSLM